MSVDFKEIYDLYKDLVYNLCLSYLSNIEDAEDATQEVFVKIHKQGSSFQGKSALKTWIYRVAINYCLDVLKARKRVKRFAFISSIFYPNSNQIKHDVVEFNHPGIQLENKEAMESLFAQINDLPRQQQTALILVKVEQLSMKEAAEVMEKTPKSVESLLGRAKQNLKKKYVKRGIENKMSSK